MEMMDYKNTPALQGGAVIPDGHGTVLGQFKYLFTLEHIFQRNAYIGSSGCLCRY